MIAFVRGKTLKCKSLFTKNLLDALTFLILLRYFVLTSVSTYLICVPHKEQITQV